MKRVLILAAFAALTAAQLFGSYVVVMKDGTRYKAKKKWTVSGGKALIQLENGQTLSLDPSLIDAAKSEEVSKLGMGDVAVLGVEQATPQPSQQKAPSLGSAVRIRPRAEFGVPAPEAPTPGATTAPVTPAVNQLDSRIAANFERAYENLGIYERKLTGTNRVVRAEVTADNEDRVFNVISATAFLIVRNAGLDGVQIDMVELFMKTTNGGAAGRFQISRADAEMLNNKAISIQDYYVRKVIY